MKIKQSRSTSGVRKTGRKGASSGSAGLFSLAGTDEVSASSAPSTMSSVSAIGDISSLLAVQGAQADPRQERAVRQGFDVLDALDALKLDVLSGQVSRQKLTQLASMVAKQREKLADPALMNVLDHIELRARVELAKFEQSAA